MTTRAYELVERVKSYEPDADEAGWHELAVPSHWRTHPALGATDGPVLHRRRFEGPGLAEGQRAWLTFDGLFYQGDVWLDGTYVGATEGYFAPHRFEVT